MTDEDIIELVYSEALALPDDLDREEGGCDPYDFDILRWAATRLKERVREQLQGREA